MNELDEFLEKFNFYEGKKKKKTKLKIVYIMYYILGHLRNS